MLMAGIKEVNVDKAIAFVETIAPIISVSNSDGLGYAAVDKDGNLFGERWHKNSDAFKSIAFGDAYVSNQFSGAIKDTLMKGDYNSFGEVALSKMVAITLHARFATSGKQFKNTHPFLMGDTSLIHNGVISNDTDWKSQMITTCDSEAILCSYTNNDVAIKPHTIEAVAGELVGYYATAVLSRDEDNNRIMDVFKGHNNNLVVAYIEELETWVMSTFERDIKAACDKLGFTMGKAFDVNDGVLIRINPVTGETILMQDFHVGKRHEYVEPKSYKKQGGGTILDMTKTERRATLEAMEERDAWEWYKASGYYE
jgi:hypothetical protein